jgi:hypothetical protein
VDWITRILGRGGGGLTSEDSRDTSEPDFRRPALLVQPYTAKGIQNASEIIAPLLDNLQLRLLEDFEEGTITLQPRLNLTAENVFDIFFVTEFVRGFEEDTGQEKKSIVEIIQDATIKQQRSREPFCILWDYACKLYKKDKEDAASEESQSDLQRIEDDHHKARNKFDDKNRHEQKRLKGIKQVDFVDIARTDLPTKDSSNFDSSDIAQNLRKELGDHRIRIVRIKDGEQTVGLLLMFGRDDEERIETYKEKLEEDNKKLILFF